jgi:uncharacterized membrane protein YraQ (UPF0718 family)
LSNLILYGIVLVLLLVSFSQNRKKTKLALMKAWKSFENILPQFLSIILLVGLLLALLNPQTIASLIGSRSGWWGTILAASVGAITLIPGFVAFPTAALLMKGGAGVMQVGAFISTLMMVGIVTLPLEIQFFGKKVAFIRNGSAYLFSFVVAFILLKVVGA